MTLEQANRSFDGAKLVIGGLDSVLQVDGVVAAQDRSAYRLQCHFEVAGQRPITDVEIDVRFPELAPPESVLVRLQRAFDNGWTPSDGVLVLAHS